MLIRRRTYRALIRRAETHRLAAITASRTVAALVRNAESRAGGLPSRLDRALRACARYRHEAAASARRVRYLEGQLDHALGLTSPEIEAGAGWQSRRHDKRKEYSA